MKGNSLKGEVAEKLVLTFYKLPQTVRSRWEVFGPAQAAEPAVGIETRIGFRVRGRVPEDVRF